MPPYCKVKSDSCQYEVLPQCQESAHILQPEPQRFGRKITSGLRWKKQVCFPIGHACQKSSVFVGCFQGTITLPASSPVAVVAAAGSRILVYVTGKPEWMLLSDSYQ